MAANNLISFFAVLIEFAVFTFIGALFHNLVPSPAQELMESIEPLHSISLPAVSAHVTLPWGAVVWYVTFSGYVKNCSFEQCVDPLFFTIHFYFALKKFNGAWVD